MEEARESAPYPAGGESKEVYILLLKGQSSIHEKNLTSKMSGELVSACFRLRDEVNFPRIIRPATHTSTQKLSCNFLGDTSEFWMQIFFQKTLSVWMENIFIVLGRVTRSCCGIYAVTYTNSFQSNFRYEKDEGNFVNDSQIRGLTICRQIFEISISDQSENSAEKLQKVRKITVILGEFLQFSFYEI